jgi:hypothetical protein
MESLEQLFNKSLPGGNCLIIMIELLLVLKQKEKDGTKCRNTDRNMSLNFSDFKTSNAGKKPNKQGLDLHYNFLEKMNTFNNFKNYAF